MPDDDDDDNTTNNSNNNKPQSRFARLWIVACETGFVVVATTAYRALETETTVR